MGQQNNRLPIHWDFVFRWFEMLLSAPLPTSVIYTKGTWVVLPWSDPSQMGVKLPKGYDDLWLQNHVKDRMQHGLLFTSTSTGLCEPGHYILVAKLEGIDQQGTPIEDFFARQPSYGNSAEYLATRSLSVGFTNNRTSQVSPHSGDKQKKVGRLYIVHSAVSLISDRRYHRLGARQFVERYGCETPGAE